MFKIDPSYIVIAFFVLFVVYKFLCIKFEAFESFKGSYATPTRPFCDDEGYQPLASGNPYNELENELIGQKADQNQLFVKDKEKLRRHLQFLTPEEKEEINVVSEAEEIKKMHQEMNMPYTFLEKKLFYDGIYNVEMGPMGNRTFTLYNPADLKNYVKLQTDKYFHIPETELKVGQELVGEKEKCCQGINLKNL